MLSNQQREIDWSIELDPWGNTIKEHNPKNLEQLIRFKGQYYDKETGLHYNQHRYYDPKLGRYLNQDPIGLDGGDSNIFNYVLNNPMNWSDPVGLDSACGVGWISTKDPNPNNPSGVTCKKDPNAVPDQKVCVTAACAAGVLPGKQDNRTQGEMDKGVCELSMNIAMLPAAAVPVNGVAKMVVKKGAVAAACAHQK